MIIKEKIRIWQSGFQIFKRVAHQQKENKTAVVSQAVLLKPEHFCRNLVRSGLGLLPTSCIPKGITGQCFTACWQRVFLSSAWSRGALEGCLLCAGPGSGAGRGRNPVVLSGDGCLPARCLGSCPRWDPVGTLLPSPTGGRGGAATPMVSQKCFVSQPAKVEWFCHRHQLHPK